MRFEPIVHIYIFDIKGNICYNKGMGKSSYSKIVVIITLKYFGLKLLDSLRNKGVFSFMTYNINNGRGYTWLRFIC